MSKILKSLVITLLLTPALALAHGPSRLKVEKEVEVNVPPAKAWALLKDFCAIEKWHPAVAKCTGNGGNAVGATRQLRLNDANSGPTIDEEMLKYDDAKMMYKYKITKVDPTVVPVANYASEIHVEDNGKGGSKVVWKGGFYRVDGTNNPKKGADDEAATGAINGIYDGGLAKIKTLLEGGK
jgi:hypothetical protein